MMEGISNMQWYDWVRVAQSCLALSAMYFLGRTWIRQSQNYSLRLKDFWWVLSVVMFVFMVGPLEQIIRQREESWTMFVSLCATLICLKATLSKEQVLLKSDAESRSK